MGMEMLEMVAVAVMAEMEADGPATALGAVAVMVGSEETVET